MRKILILLTSIGLLNVAEADTQDYIKCRVILVKSSVAYFDAGQKDGVAAGQDFEFLYDEQVVGTGKVAWADQNISRSEPLDSASASSIRLSEPLIAKISLITTSARRAGFLNIPYFSDLDLEPGSIVSPEEMMLGRLIYRGLLTRDNNGQIQPDLCIDYEIRDLTYTFYIDPNARFHSGKPVGSSDVAYSLEQLARAPKLTGASCFVLEINGAGEYRRNLKSEITGIYIIDEKTIAITLRRPFPAFENYLAGPAGYIIPRPGEVSTGLSVDAAGSYRVKWINQAGVTLVPDVSGGQDAQLDSICFVRFTNPEEAGLAFDLGKLDLIGLLGEPPPKFASRGNYSAQSSGSNAYVILGINNRRGYQAGQDFGKGLSFLLDRGSIIRVILGGAGDKPRIKISNLLETDMPLYDDVDRDSSSYYFGKVFSMPKSLNLYVDTTYSILGKVARYIEGQLQNKRIKVNEKKMNLSLSNDQPGQDMDLYLTTFIPVSDNPACVLYPLLSDSLAGQANFINYENDTVQPLLDFLVSGTDTSSLMNPVPAIVQSINADPPLLFLYQPTLVLYAKSKVSGVVGDKGGFPDLRRAYIAEAK